jgi:hypothetical protein
MDKKYQVFVSSTYEDLQEERKKVMEALLQMNCFPVGMEYFNASDDSQWEVIKSLIRECDYYVLIVAGRYGSIEEESGKSYTQKEFEYAVEQGVPVISFVHKHPDSLPAAKYEQESLKREKLEKFKSCIKKKLCKFWENADELSSQVILSLNSLIKSHPRTGWVKADEVSSAEANKELISLRKENDLLKSKIRALSFQIPEGTERYKQGEDKFTIHYTHDYELLSYENEAKIYKKEVSWNEIFLSISTLLLSPTYENTMYSEMTKNLLGEHFDIINDDFQTILIQLMALKLIATDTIKVDGIYTYWILTEYGKNVMVNLRAQKK